MKVLKRKELQTLSLVDREPPQDRRPVIFPRPAPDAIRLSETESIRRPRLSATEVKRRLSLLSAVDVMRVNRATIREGEAHCVWRPEIVEKFRTADVITETAVSHYVLREVNLNRVK